MSKWRIFHRLTWRALPALWLCLLCSCAQTSGTLLIAGGGPLPTDFFERALAEVAAPSPAVLVFPQASALEDTGARSAAAWAKAGAATTWVAKLEHPAELLKQINSADLIWFTGGSQLKLVKALRTAQLISPIQLRLHQGVAIGGTSAGAAAMGELMISGPPDPAPYFKGAMPTHPGLGLCPGLLIDQHFMQRNRNHRLLTAVLDNPTQVGVGISESTILVLRGKTAEVWGKGPVHIYDARAAQIENPDDRLSGRNLNLSLLQVGEKFYF